MSIPGRLEVASDGRVTGAASITYNDPFPCVNGNYGSGAIRGVVMHTMVGNLPGTVQCFNEASFQASAHFGIDQQGSIHQFGPIGKGWIAWAEMAGNDTWYSIEHADDANTQNPLTQAQVTASAQLFEVLSRFAGFPLQVTDSIDGTGYGTHVMGGQAWGGHSCPGPGPRAGQRKDIAALARSIRAGGATTSKPATTPGDDPVLTLTSGSYPLSIPEGTKYLHLVPSQSPASFEVTITFHGSDPVKASMSWAHGSHFADVPRDCHAATLTVPRKAAVSLSFS